MKIIEVEFEKPTEARGFRLFSDKLENDPNVLFHGTSEDFAESIMDKGFMPNGELPSTSFVTTSSVPLKYACEMRGNGQRGAVLAAEFETSEVDGFRKEGDVVYLDDHRIQPKKIYYCYIPDYYKHI